MTPLLRVYSSRTLASVMLQILLTIHQTFMSDRPVSASSRNANSHTFSLQFSKQLLIFLAFSSLLSLRNISYYLLALLQISVFDACKSSPRTEACHNQNKPAIYTLLCVVRQLINSPCGLILRVQTNRSSIRQNEDFLPALNDKIYTMLS